MRESCISVGFIKRIIFKEDHSYGFIKGNLVTNGLDCYFEVKNFSLKTGDFVSFEVHKRKDGKYFASNVVPLGAKSDLWKMLCSPNGKDLYDWIKACLNEDDFRRFWDDFPDNFYTENEWILQNLTGRNTLRYLDSLVSNEPESHEKLILKIIEQNKTEFLSYRSFFVNHIKSFYPKILDYILEHDTVMDIMGADLPKLIDNIGSQTLTLDRIPERFITENILNKYTGEQVVRYLSDHDELREKYQRCFVNNVNFACDVRKYFYLSLPEKVITKDILKLLSPKDQINCILNHQGLLDKFYECFKKLAEEYKAELDSNIIFTVKALECFSYQQQKRYLLQYYNDSLNRIVFLSYDDQFNSRKKNDEELIGYLKNLVLNKTEIFSLEEIPKDLLNEEIIPNLSLHDKLTYYQQQIGKYAEEETQRKTYKAKWQRTVLENVSKVDVSLIDTRFVTKSIFDAFSKDQKSDYVVEQLLKYSEWIHTIHPDAFLNLLSQCGNLKLEKIGKLSKSFLDDQRLLLALQKSNNTPCEKVLFIYQLVKNYKMTKNLISCLEPDEGSIYAPVHYLACYYFSKNEQDYYHMHESFLKLIESVYKKLENSAYDIIAEELYYILPSCCHREYLQFGSEYRYFCDAVFAKESDSNNKCNAPKSWCRGSRSYIENSQYNEDICPHSFSYRRLSYNQWTLAELFDKLKITPLLVVGLKHPEDYIPKICSAFNWLFKKRQLLECSFCHKLMQFDLAYSKERQSKANTNIFAAYVNTVAGCIEAKDEKSKHDYRVYLNHCHTCGEDTVIDSRVSHFQDFFNNRKYYLCMECGSGGIYNDYYVTVPGTICPKCGSDDMQYLGYDKLRGYKQHIFQCNECRHKVGLRKMELFNRLYGKMNLKKGENLQGKEIISKEYELYRDNVLVKKYDVNLKKLVDVLPKEDT